MVLHSGLVQAISACLHSSLGQREQGAVQPKAVEAVRAKLKFTKAALIYTINDDVSKSSADTFETKLKGLGVTLVAKENINTGDASVSDQLGRIKTAGPEILIITSLGPDALKIMKAAWEIGITARFMGGNNFNSLRLMNQVVAATNGAISGAAWDMSAQAPGNAAFITAFRAKYGAGPDQPAAQAYTDVYLLAYAIKNAGAADSSSIRVALAQLKDIDTVLGKLSTSAGRETVHNPIVQEYKDGAFQLFK